MLVDYFLGSAAEGFALSGGFALMLWMLFCVVYAILLFCIPFILYGIMKNTKRTADLLAEIRAFQERPIGQSLANTSPPPLPTPVSTIPKVVRSSVNLRLNDPANNP
jgi:ABC-type transport system involved in multi-copper enzyme maturation permease subunit